MKRKLFILLSTFFVLSLISFPASAQFVYDFHWLNTNVEVGIGETAQLQYTYSSNTMGTDEIFSDWSNLVFYEYNSSINMFTVVEEPTVFSINGSGLITGLKAGSAQIKPTGFILKASGYTDRCTIKVISQRNEQESNNTWETANELGLIPTRFNLNTIVDQDFFKAYAKKSQHLIFRIKGSNSYFSLFKWAAYGPDYTRIGGGSIALTDGVRDVEIENWLINALGEGYYYLQIYFDPSRPQFYTSDYMTVEAVWVDENAVIPGDVDGDGHVSSVDITALYNYLLNDDNSNLVNGDQDTDGHITSNDITVIYNIMLGNS